jgi:hypothetical protein
VRETQDDLQRLDALLAASYEAAGSHLRAIHLGPTRVVAEQLVRELDGMRVLVVATVTADGRPLTGPVDGHLYRGAWVFGTSPDAVRARHLAVRPAISATYVRGEEFVSTVHGTAVPIDARTYDDGGFAEVARATYGEEWTSWGLDAPTWRIDARRMFAADTSILPQLAEPDENRGEAG